MKKGVIIGVVIVVVIGIGVISSMYPMENNEEDVLLSEEELILDEIISIEEDLEEPEKTGRNITVELTETIGLKGP